MDLDGEHHTRIYTFIRGGKGKRRGIYHHSNTSLRSRPGRHHMSGHHDSDDCGYFFLDEAHALSNYIYIYMIAVKSIASILIRISMQPKKPRAMSCFPT